MHNGEVIELGCNLYYTPKTANRGRAGLSNIHAISNLSMKYLNDLFLLLAVSLQ